MEALLNILAICLSAAGGACAPSSVGERMPVPAYVLGEGTEYLGPLPPYASNSVDVTISGDTPNIPYDAQQYAQTHKTDTYIYFSNLEENMPTNRAGTCGYVALAMILNYLDTFWNDFFVEERFEAHTSIEIPDTLWTVTPQMKFRAGSTPSPGCFDDIDSTYLTMSGITSAAEALSAETGQSIYSARDAICLAEAKRSANAGSLQGYLFQLAIEEGFVNSSYSGSALQSLSIGADAQTNILNAILERNGLLEEWQIIHPGLAGSGWKRDVDTMQKYRDDVAYFVSKGFPVIVQGLKWTQSQISNIEDGIITIEGDYFYHSAVAYGINANGTLIGNMGWKGIDRERNFDFDFNLGFDDYVAIVPKEGWEHTHSDNYRIDDDDLASKTSWCPCNAEMIVRQVGIPDLGLMNLPLGNNWYGFDIDGDFTLEFDGVSWEMTDEGPIMSLREANGLLPIRISSLTLWTDEAAYRIDLQGHLDFNEYVNSSNEVIALHAVDSNEDVVGEPYLKSAGASMTDRWGEVARDGWDNGLSVSVTNGEDAPFGIMLYQSASMPSSLTSSPIEITIESFQIMELC